jgi:GH24 family phage-related lysozyme (muramidase)
MFYVIYSLVHLCFIATPFISSNTVCTVNNSQTAVSVEEQSVEYIKKWEGYAEHSYRDTSWRYSIGYGSRSYQWETITEQWATNRLRGTVRQVLSRVKKDFPDASDSQLVALVSVAFNCHSWIQKLKKHWIAYHKTPWFCQLEWYDGLRKRRESERLLLFK